MVAQRDLYTRTACRPRCGSPSHSSNPRHNTWAGPNKKQRRIKISLQHCWLKCPCTCSLTAGHAWMPQSECTLPPLSLQACGTQVKRKKRWVTLQITKNGADCIVNSLSVVFGTCACQKQTHVFASVSTCAHACGRASCRLHYLFLALLLACMGGERVRV